MEKLGNRSVRPAERMTQILPPKIRAVLDAARKLSESGKKIFNMTAGDPDFPTPKHIVAAAKKALNEGFTHYVSHVGIQELRNAIGEKLRKENNVKVEPSRIIVSPGSGPAGSNSVLSAINPGDEVIILEPAFYNYQYWVRMAGGKPIFVPLDAKRNFKPSFHNLREKISEKTKMIIFNSPCNPTSSVFERKDVEKIADIAKRNDLLVLSDEVYEKIIYNGSEHVSTASLPGMSDFTFTVNSFSKTYAMTGWRVGYVAAPEQFVESIQSLNIYNTSYPAGFVQKAAVAALLGPQECVAEMVSEYDNRRRILIEALQRTSLPYVEPEGTFYFFIDTTELSKDSEKAAVNLLRKHGIATVPGSAFGPSGDGYVRISYTTSTKLVEEVAEVLKKL